MPMLRRFIARSPACHELSASLTYWCTAPDPVVGARLGARICERRVRGSEGADDAVDDDAVDSHAAAAGVEVRASLPDSHARSPFPRPSGQPVRFAGFDISPPSPSVVRNWVKSRAEAEAAVEPKTIVAPSAAARTADEVPRSLRVLVAVASHDQCPHPLEFGSQNVVGGELGTIRDVVPEPPVEHSTVIAQRSARTGVRAGVEPVERDAQVGDRGHTHLP